MYQLPNRVYYVQFVDMDAAKMRATIINVLLYCLVELVSLVVLDSVLRRKLRFSTLRQLAFVLDQQAAHVQSALIVWVFYTTQVSLDHYGRPQAKISLGHGMDTSREMLTAIMVIDCRC